ncbi:MAG: glucose-1-phosphate adenylyltransferase subunit GlgD [Clostridia bacterium]|nr:glucose-1-phosphate adenylyltransferase subunit GlgD [Clostridia bacterium]
MKITGLIFSGMYNDGLDYLTRNRTVASLPFGGRYRQIDFVLSNMVNSGIQNIGVITKYNYQSLMTHLGSCQDWDLNRKRGGLTILPPFGTGNSGGYRGKIEELRAALPYLSQQDTEFVVLTDTDTICSIDFRDVVEAHVESEADITVIAARAYEPDASTSELVFDSLDGKTAESIYLNYAARGGQYTSLGMYVIRRELLIEKVTALAARGFYHLERDFIQQGFNRDGLKLGLYRFDRLAMKNRNILEYYHNSLKMKDETVRNEIFRPAAPIYTTVRDEVPTYYGSDSEVTDCLIADGCRIYGKADNSVLFRGVIIEKNAVVRNSVIMAGCVIREGAMVENAIIDKEATVSSLRKIVGAPSSPMIVQKGDII